MTSYTPTVTLKPSGKQFDCIAERSILDAGLSAGFALPYRCANGSCGDCRATVLSGDVTRIKFHDYVLTEAEKIAGVCLLCSNAALSDLTLQVNEAQSVADIPYQELKAKRCRIEQLNDLTVFSFKFVRGKAFRFLPGQFATLTFPAGDTVQLPIASCPCNAQYVEFHIPLHCVRRACAYQLCDSLSALERVTVTGPSGEFTLSKELNVPKLFIAIGEGFASAQGLLEHLINLEIETPCTLLWVATQSVSHYRHNLCRSWQDAIDEFTYIPIMPAEDFVPIVRDIVPENAGQLEVYISGEDAGQSLPNNRFADLLSCLRMSGASISMI